MFGNHTTVTVAGAWGQFELNVFKPVLIASLLQSIRHGLCELLSEAVEKNQLCEAGLMSN